MNPLSERDGLDHLISASATFFATAQASLLAGRLYDALGVFSDVDFI